MNACGNFIVGSSLLKAPIANNYWLLSTTCQRSIGSLSSIQPRCYRLLKHPGIRYTMYYMTKDDIITLPNPHLREKSRRIHVITPEITDLITDMTAATLDWEASRPYEIGAALAAIQVDRLERIVIVRSDLDDKANRNFTALINPEVIKLEGEVVYDHEGCLSVKNVYGLV